MLLKEKGDIYNGSFEKGVLPMRREMLNKRRERLYLPVEANSEAQNLTGSTYTRLTAG